MFSDGNSVCLYRQFFECVGTGVRGMERGVEYLSCHSRMVSIMAVVVEGSGRVIIRGSYECLISNNKGIAFFWAGLAGPWETHTIAAA